MKQTSCITHGIYIVFGQSRPITLLSIICRIINRGLISHNHCARIVIDKHIIERDIRKTCIYSTTIPDQRIKSGNIVRTNCNHVVAYFLNGRVCRYIGIYMKIIAYTGLSILTRMSPFNDDSAAITPTRQIKSILTIIQFVCTVNGMNHIVRYIFDVFLTFIIIVLSSSIANDSAIRVQLKIPVEVVTLGRIEAERKHTIFIFIGIFKYITAVVCSGFFSSFV